MTNNTPPGMVTQAETAATRDAWERAIEAAMRSAKYAWPGSQADLDARAVADAIARHRLASLSPPITAVDAEQIARLFHDTYERLAPAFGYETREITRVFDPASPNGRLMIAACSEVAKALRQSTTIAESEGRLREAARNYAAENDGDHWCQRIRYGQCSIRKCNVEGGWAPGTPADFSLATCARYRLETALQGCAQTPEEMSDEG